MPRGSQSTARRQHYAELFAALGDPTRLQLVTKLCEGSAQSISDLSAGSHLTRQAITKHLRVLESVGLVENLRAGRESLFEIKEKPLNDMREYLQLVSAQWDQALLRLQKMVESEDSK